MTKNVQIIDGAENCAYDVFVFEDEVFKFFFPDDGQDISFIEDVIDFRGEDELSRVSRDIWDRRLKKTDVKGIHGILFYGLRDRKGRYYPNRRDSDLDGVGRAG